MEKFNLNAIFRRNLSYLSPKCAVGTTQYGEKGLFARKTIRQGEIVSISVGIGIPKKAIKKVPETIRQYCYYMENGFFYCPPQR